MNLSKPVLSDPELIKAVRNGDISAFAGLYNRHADAAYRLASVLTHNPDEVHRLVSNSFSTIRLALLAGGGPSVAFRTYLLSTVRGGRPVTKEPAMGLLDEMALPKSADSVAGRALSRLPARWQLVLWHLDVEREAPFRVGQLVGLTPDEVTMLAGRARERMQLAYLRAMEEQALDDDCAWVAHRFATGVPQDKFDPDRIQFDTHLAEHGRCWQLCAEFRQIEHELDTVVGPLVLGGLAESYCPGINEAPGQTAAGRASEAESALASRYRILRIALVSAIVAGVATLVLIVALRAGSPPPTPATGSNAPLVVADTGQPTSVRPGVPVGDDGADVSVRVTGTLVRGRSTQLQLLVANEGPASSGILTMVIRLPAGVTLGGSLPSPWDCSGRTTTLVCSHPPLSPHATTAGALMVSVDPVAPLGARATAVLTAAQADPADGNNRATTTAGLQASQAP